eukprot:15479169-Alexandrium_andersonii.AAC.1
MPAADLAPRRSPACPNRTRRQRIAVSPPLRPRQVERARTGPERHKRLGPGLRDPPQAGIRSQPRFCAAGVDRESA